MLLGRVMGTVVASAKWATLDGWKLLLVQPLDRYEKNAGAPLVAIDRVGVGPGELVMLEKSKEAILGLSNELTPADAAIVGRVDVMTLSE